MKLALAKDIMGSDLIGPEELRRIGSLLGIAPPRAEKTPVIPWGEKELVEAKKRGYLLILGVPKTVLGKKLTLTALRARFGTDPQKAKPCFYHQDWYLRERFAVDVALEQKWYLIKKKVEADTRGKTPEEIAARFSGKRDFTPAILVAFAFFAYYFHMGGEILWEHDFLWCVDKDANGDRIYVGRYRDPNRLNTDGFNIHRHLSLRSCYGAAPQLL